jgi:hypothetical protein
LALSTSRGQDVGQQQVRSKQHNFDWVPTQRTRDGQVERVIVLSATLYEDHRAPDGRGWVTLLDPELHGHRRRDCLPEGPGFER